MVQPRTFVDENIYEVINRIDDRGGRPRTGSDQDISSDEDSNLFSRPVTGSATAEARQDTRGPTKEYGTNIGRMVKEAMMEMARNDVNLSENNYQDPVKKIASVIRRAWAENNARPV